MRRKPCVQNCSRKREIVQESGIELTQCRNEQRITEYKIKEVPNIVHAERIQRSPETVF